MAKDRRNIESIEQQVARQIAYHEQQIANLRFALKTLKENPPQPAELFKLNTPLTRDLIRRFLKATKRSMKTVEIIDILYPNCEEKKRTKLIRTLSVILNQMNKENEITIEKKQKVKGSYYSLSK